MTLKRRSFLTAGLGFAAVSGWACLERSRIGRALPLVKAELEQAIAGPPDSYAKAAGWSATLVTAAESQIGRTVRYDPAYVQIAYPSGDIPIERGVCTDVIVRAYRDAFALDLQQAVHEDMRRNFTAYPRLWQLKAPDPNIDHRRVPNLATYLKHQGATLPRSKNPEDYRPGDVVTYLFPNNRTHIAIVSDRASRDGKRPLIIHNNGLGTRRNDMLFSSRIIGHFRYPPPATTG
jgi:hypothetical protein